jgi:hypothetical protein
MSLMNGLLNQMAAVLPVDMVVNTYRHIVRYTAGECLWMHKRAVPSLQDCELLLVASSCWMNELSDTVSCQVR